MGLRIGFITGMLLGSIFGFEMAGMGDLLPYPLDAFLFIVPISLIGGIFCMGLFILLFFFLRLIFFHQRNVTEKIGRILGGAGIFIVIGSQSLLGFFEINRPISLHRFKTIAAIFIILCLALGVSYLLASLFCRFKKNKPLERKKNGVKRPVRWAANYLLLLAGTLVVVSFFITRTPVRRSPLKQIEKTGKLLLLGIDAADWNTLLPLIRAGKLPNFKKLIHEGVSGPLSSLITMWGPIADTITYGIHSPAVWNSVLTGKSPFRHGIKDFIYTKIPGIKHPFRYRLIPSFVPSRKKIEQFLNLEIRPSNRLLRKSKTAWNILSDVGLKVGALGWWVTWPAEVVNGVLLTDRFANPNLKHKWFPPTLVKTADVNSLLGRVKHPEAGDVGYFTSFPYNPQYKEDFDRTSRKYMINDLLNNLFSNFYLDMFRSQLGQQLLHQNDYSLLAVYFYGLDIVGHAFERFKHPELFVDVEPDEVKYFGDIIDKYYIWIDQEIGKYLQKIDQKTTVIICSDHGMGPWLKMASKKKGVRLSGSHRKNGIVIFWGNHVRANVKTVGSNVLDIFPTLLYLIGLPIPQDIDGSVIKDAIDPAYLSASPVQTIKTYETRRYAYKPAENEGPSQSADKTLMERLKSLGYLN